MDSPVTLHQYHLRADARGYAIDIVHPDGGHLLFATTCNETRDRADPQTNAQRGQLTAKTLGIAFSAVEVGKDLGVSLYMERPRQ